MKRTIVGLLSLLAVTVVAFGVYFLTIRNANVKEPTAFAVIAVRDVEEKTPNFIDGQIQIIRSPLLLEKVAAHLGQSTIADKLPADDRATWLFERLLVGQESGQDAAIRLRLSAADSGTAKVILSEIIRIYEQELAMMGREPLHKKKALLESAIKTHREKSEKFQSELLATQKRIRAITYEDITVISSRYSKRVEVVQSLNIQQRISETQKQADKIQAVIIELMDENRKDEDSLSKLRPLYAKIESLEKNMDQREKIMDRLESERVDTELRLANAGNRVLIQWPPSIESAR